MRSLLRFSVIVGAGAVSSLPALAAVPAYTLAGSFALPAGTTTFDVLPDGRVLAIRAGELLRQDAPNAASFSRVGSVSPSLINTFGASFIKVSPDATRIAIGDGNFGPGASVLILNTAALDPFSDSPVSAVVTPNYDAAWADASTLLVTGAQFGVGSYLNRVSADTLTSTTVLSGIGDGSGGVAIHAGRAYIGAGFDFSPGAGVETGDIRAVDLSALLTTPAALDYASQGVLAGRALSATYMSFDAVGTLAVGGGDFSGESGFAALLDPAVLDAALFGGPIATSATAQNLAPAGNQFYSTVFSPSSGEFLLRAFGSDTVYRYAVPAPSVGMMVMFSGLFAHRRRRA